MANKVSNRIVEGMPWLDPLADTLQQAIRQQVAANEPAGTMVKDALHGRWLGHPLHPALVSVPLGAWTATLVLDLAGMEDGADLTLGVGIAGAVGAALAGWADWSDTDGEPRRAGILHALLNVGGLSLNVVSLLMRRTGNRRNGVLISTMAYGLGSLSAFLGGELAYTLGVGVNHAAWDEPPIEFTPLMPLADLAENTPTRAMAGSMPVLLVRLGQDVFAFDAHCTHAGAPLDEGTLDGNTITCPWHGSQFCVRNGATQRGPAVNPLTQLKVRLQNGTIEVRRSS